MTARPVLLWRAEIPFALAQRSPPPQVSVLPGPVAPGILLKNRFFQATMARVARRAAQTILTIFVLAGFWIGCVATLRPHEMIVGAAAVVLATASSLYVVSVLPLRFRPAPQSIAQAGRLPGSVIVDCWRIVRVLIRDLLGRRAPSLFRAAPYRLTAASGQAAAQRVLATAFASVTPNVIVVGIDRERGQLLFHQLRATPVPRILLRLGAESGR